MYHRIILVIISYTLLFSQNKMDFFLNDTENLSKLKGEKGAQIQKELDEIIEEFNKEIYKTVSTKIIYEKEYSEPYFDRDGYLSARQYYGNLSIIKIQILKDQFTSYRKYTKTISENRKYEISKTVYEYKPKWEDVVSKYGGYSELINKGIKKDDWENAKYNVKGELESIELLDSINCVCNVEVSGNLEFNDIKQSSYQYNGTFEVESLDESELYKRKSPLVYLSCPKKTYLPSQKLEVSIKIFLLEEYNSISDKYISGIKMIIEDMVDDEEFYNIPEIKSIIKEKEDKKKKEKVEKKEREKRKREEEKLKLENEEKKREKKRKALLRNHRYAYVSYGIHKFDNTTFRQNIGKLYSKPVTISVGGVFNKSPFKLDFNMSSVHYGQSNPIPFDEEYFDDSELFWYPNIEEYSINSYLFNVSILYDIVPDFIIRPFMGIGYQYSYITLGHTTLGQQVESNTSDIFITGSLLIFEYNIEDVSFFIDISYQKSLTLELKKWNQIYIKFGLGEHNFVYKNIFINM